VFEVVLLLLAVAAVAAFLDWRRGLLLVVITALLQDPLRKLVEGQPVIFVVLVGIVFAAACLGACFARVPMTPNSMYAWQRGLALPVLLTVLLIILQAYHSYVNFGNVMLPMIGLLTYLAPLPAIVFGYQLAVRGGPPRIKQFFKVYLVCTVVALVSVYLEYSGVGWSILGEVGRGQILHERGVAVVRAIAGTFRASEIAAWHAATCACLCLLLASERKLNLQTVLGAAGIILFVLGAGLLTGRRKMIVEVAIFFGAYFILWAMFQRGKARLGLVLAVAGLIGYFALIEGLGVDTKEATERSLVYDFYLERSKRAFGEVPARFVELGLAPLMWAYEGFGAFGAGLGVGTQGGQHFGGGGQVAGAAEGGLGKIMLELGIPGLVLIGWLGLFLGRHLLWILRMSSQMAPELARLCYGLVSFLLANIATFTVATQAYGDLFILLILSSCLGFVLAIPAIVEQEARARRADSIQRSVRHHVATRHPGFV
jgi:hypothetical protein